MSKENKIETEIESFIFCSDVICEADAAVSYLEATMQIMEAKNNQLKKTIEFKDGVIIKLEKEVLRALAKIEHLCG